MKCNFTISACHRIAARPAEACLYLNHIRAQNFRVFGCEPAAPELKWELSPALNILVGENDAGKSAVVDAIQQILWTTSFDYIRLQETDFHIAGAVRADSLFIMTTDEASRWVKGFKTPGVYPWVTTGSDIEAFFCQADYLCALYGVELHVAEQWRQQAAEKVGKAHDTFLEKRRNIVRTIWPNGGSPDAEAMWGAAGGKSPSTVKGKKLLAALKTVVTAAGKDEALLNAWYIPAGFTLAPDLQRLIDDAIKGEPS